MRRTKYLFIKKGKNENDEQFQVVVEQEIRDKGKILYYDFLDQSKKLKMKSTEKFNRQYEHIGYIE
jgi:hypothetical protein